MSLLPKATQSNNNSKTRNLKSTLDFLLQKIESIKGKQNLEEIFVLIGKELKKINTSTIVSIVDNKKQSLIIRNVSLIKKFETILPVEKIKKIKIELEKLVKYKEVLNNKNAIFVKNRLNIFKKKLPTIKPFLKKTKTKDLNSIISPLMLKGEVIGFFEFISSDLKPENLSAVKDFSNKFVLKLANTILFQEIMASENRYRGLFEKAQQGFAVLNCQKKKLIDINKKFCKITGYSRDELLQINFLLLIEKNELEKINNFIKKTIAEKPYNQKTPLEYETVLITKNKKRCYIRIVIIQLLSEKEWFITLEDITNKKKIEKELKRQKEKAEKYLNLANNIIIALDKKGFIKLLNKKGYELLNYKEGELAGKDWFENCLPANARKKTKAVFKKIISGNLKEFENYENPIITKQGKERIINWHNTYIKNKAGEITKVLSSGEDITSRKLTDEALRESEEKYRKLVNNMEEGVAIINPTGYINFANRALQKIFKYSGQELKKLHFSKLLHPNDHNLVISRFNSRLAGKKVITNYDFRIIDKNGYIKYINYSGSPILKNNKPIGIQATFRDITEYKKLLNTIESSSRHYKQVIDSIQDSICVIDKNLKIISYNTTFAKKVNMPIDKIKGLKCYEIIPRYENNLFRKHCSKYNKKTGCIITSVLNDKKPQFYIEKNTDKNGQTKYHSLNVFPSISKTGEVYQSVVIIRDKTEQKIAEEKIRQLNEFNEKILNNAPVSIMVINKKGDITATNDYIKYLTKSDGYVGKNIFQLSFFKNKELTDKYKKLFKTGVSFSKNNCQTINKEGQTKYLNIIAVPLKNNKGKIESAISMALDNTEEVVIKEKIEKLNENLEKTIIQRTRQLNEANKELARVLELKSKFISDASHELRTPLTIIQGNLDLAIREADIKKGWTPDLFDSINNEIQRMSGILNELTLLTDVDANTEHLSYEKINLNAMVDIMVHTTKVLALKKNIKIKFNPKKQKNLEIMGDEEKIEKLFLNILRNAIKYTDKKGLIKISLEKGNKEARIIVEDSGIGIPKEDLLYIFERFYRVDKARSRKEGGTGLGLSICKWIAEAHGGYISVESELNKGSIFTIHLPFDYKTKKTKSSFANL
ncbi:hypothetical protein DRH27_03330 [Candidatus Falkowbacteria bacterium]|nr:MAG: hypothetical protein DRH27_03330 [Candidatus Falkowbacteria bacterium]